MASELDKFSELVSDELVEFRSRYFEFISSNVRIIDQAVKFLSRTHGKLVRPMITLLAARLSGPVSDDTFKAAMIVELIHNATLVHDDVVDEVDKRRGLPALHRIFGNKISILFGDYLLANSLIGMLDLRDFRVFEILSTTSKQLSKGELLQAARAHSLDMDRQGYFDMITQKTAVLLAAACQLGGVTSGASEEQVEALRQFGLSMGIAFQIQDDVLDYTGDSKRFGKPVGTDLREKKITLPLLYLLENMSAMERRMTLIKLRIGSRRHIRQLIRQVLGSGGIEHAQRVAEQYIRDAVSHLNLFPDSKIKSALVGFSEFLVVRTY